ncbi:hypothetical protein ME763_36855 (plasmid) [Streptomyces murinus]|uniref:hypothetical protein n=1 Tax=Streptomyces murinus TaxID=33900 RepID=UPI000A1F4968|nr:hypothetical protein [Streptomyces murinus]WDO11309.1 hypothetical protein ME763_36855 [Streptomyces murinus]
MREEVARLQGEAERVQAALGGAERALQWLVDARATVAEMLAGPPSAVAEPHRGSVVGSVSFFNLGFSCSGGTSVTCTDAESCHSIGGQLEEAQWCLIGPTA